MNMICTGKKHYGESIQSLVIKDPGYVMWMARKQDLRDRMAKERAEGIRLVDVLDSKPIVARCSGQDCLTPATRLTVADGRSSGMYAWCDHCRPISDSGKPLTVIRTYRDALRHNEANCRNTRAGRKSVVLALAKAKGLKPPLTQATLDAFFLK